MKRWIVIAWALTLGVAAFAIAGKERVLARGDVVFLKLAPVDPRSLMQGDYMALHFAVGDAIGRAERQGEGDTRHGAAADIAVVRTDARGEATFVRLDRGEPLAAGERRLRFQRRDDGWRGERVQVSTDAYFFQEGHAARFERARYGEFRVASDGQALLVGLRDEALAPL